MNTDRPLGPKPAPVRIALVLFWGAVLFGVAKLARTLTMMPGPGGHSFTVFAFIATYSVMALLIVYIAMGASWARGGLLAVFLIGVAPGLPLAFAHYQAIPYLAALSCAQVVSVVVGLYLVYRPPAAGWFRRPVVSSPARRRR